MSALSDFISKYGALIQENAKKYGILPSVCIADAGQETTWGTANVPSVQSDHNCFGVKTAGNHDPSISISEGSKATDGGHFTHYNCFEDSIKDWFYWLKNNSNYAAMFGKSTPEEQIQAMQDGGYCGGNYASAVINILNSNNLKQYDTGTYTGTGGSSANSSNVITVEATNYQVVKGSEKKKDVLFGRRYRITISDENGDGVDVTYLHCTFNIVKTIQMQPNTSEITIYNLNAKTENAIMMTGKRVTVEAGYEGSQFGLIFDGDIFQTIRERENGATFKLVIIGLDSDRAINFDIANYSLARGQTARDVIEHMANKAQNPIELGSISDRLKGQKLTRGKVLFGKTSDYIRQICKTYDLQNYMDDGTLNLIHLEDLPKDEIIELSPSSGLIGTPEQTDYGISGQCLINPQIKLNSLVHIDNSFVRAKRIDINGSNAVPQGGTETSTNSNVRNAIIAEAKKICDDPNVQYSQPLRGKTVDGITYWDCSSFAKHCYEVAGLSIVDITGPQYNQVANEGGKFISQSEAKPGDLVFWGKGDACHHVAIYAGDGYLYAARGRDGKAPVDQVAYHPLYGEPEFGRPKCLLDADNGNPPSCSTVNSTSNEASQSLFRALDKDGIYRIIKMTYTGDTRGNDWYINFETIDQLGGAIPAVSN